MSDYNNKKEYHIRKYSIWIYLSEYISGGKLHDILVYNIIERKWYAYNYSKVSAVTINAMVSKTVSISDMWIFKTLISADRSLMKQFE